MFPASPVLHKPLFLEAGTADLKQQHHYQHTLKSIFLDNPQQHLRGCYNKLSSPLHSYLYSWWSYLQLHVYFHREIIFFSPPPPPAIPPHVLMVVMNFRGFPPGCGNSVADFWGWDAHEARLRCPEDVSGDMQEDEITWGALSLNLLTTQTMVTTGIFPCKEKFPW